MRPILRLIVLSVVFSLAWSLTKKLENYDQFCTWKSLEVGNSLSGTFVVSGYTEDKFGAMV